MKSPKTRAIKAFIVLEEEDITFSVKDGETIGIYLTEKEAQPIHKTEMILPCTITYTLPLPENRSKIREEMVKYTYRHCEGWEKGISDDDFDSNHWKCSGIGDSGECACPCHGFPRIRNLLQDKKPE